MKNKTKLAIGLELLKAFFPLVLILSLSILVGIGVVIYFSVNIISINNHAIVPVTGKIIDYETTIKTDYDGSYTLYQEVIEYKINNEVKQYFNTEGSTIKPEIGTEFKLAYNKETKEVKSQEFAATYFPLLFFGVLFILVPVLFILILTDSKKSMTLLKLIFTFAPGIVIIYFMTKIKSINPVTLIAKEPMILIPIIMFLVGCYFLCYHLIYNEKRPHYIKLTVSRMEKNNGKLVIYFKAGIRSLYQEAYLYKTKIDNAGKFEINKTYRANITTVGPLGKLNESYIELTELTLEDFQKLD